MKTTLVRTLLFAGVALIPAFSGNQILLRNLTASDGTPKVMAAGANGQLFVISEFSVNGTQISRVVKLDANGARIGSFDLALMQTPNAALMDLQGNLVVVGYGVNQGLVIKVDPQLQSASTLLSLPANVNAVAADASGNIYITGITSSASFPVTTGAYQVKPPTGPPAGGPGYAYLTKISPTGAVLYSTYFGSDGASCLGGSFCVGKYGVTDATAIALDSSGNVVIAGTTTSNSLPTTPGALASSCVCGYSLGVVVAANAGFIAKFQPGGAQQLVWSTYLNANFSAPSLTVGGMALDSAGNVIIGGSAPPGLPVVPSGFQIPGIGTDPNGGAYLAKLNSTGTAVIWSQYFGSVGSASGPVTVDSQGRIGFSGYLGNAIPTELQYKPTFVGQVTGDGKTLIDFYQGPATFYLVGPALTNTSTGGFAAMFPGGAVWIETASPGPFLLNIANSASGAYSSAVAGVELISLYGVGIGPSSPMNGVVQGGAFTSSLGGCEVLFDGKPAPLLYADSGQINAVVPRTLNQSSHIQVVTTTGTITGPTVPTSFVPMVGIFQAALNQDGSVNSISNPATAGSIVSVFATADGGSYFPDGAVVPMGIYDAGVAVFVDDTYRSLGVQFAGAAPGLVAGVMQINFRLPDSLGPENPFTFSVTIGGGAAASGQIAVATQ